MYFQYFLLIHQAGPKWTAKNSLDMSLDIQIHAPTISL